MNSNEEQYFLDLATRVISNRATDRECREFEDLIAHSQEHRDRFEVFKADVIVAKDILSLIDASEAQGPGLNPAQLMRLKGEVDRLSSKTRKPWWGRILGIAFICLAVICFGFFISQSLRSNVVNPEQVLSMMVQSIDGNPMSASKMGNYLTDTGKQDWAWLKKHRWFKDMGKSQIISTNFVGERQKFTLKYENPLGGARISFWFISKNGITKFDDMYIYEAKKAIINMPLSRILEKPTDAQRQFDSNNPGMHGQIIFEVIKY